LAKIVNDGVLIGSRQVRDTFSGKTIRLGSGINLATRAWTPIGFSSSFFQGTFDGGGYTIENMTVNIVIDDASSRTYVFAGLFGHNRGKLTGVNLSNIYVAFSSSSYSYEIG
jgi:hypothetical protein